MTGHPPAEPGTEWFQFIRSQKRHLLGVTAAAWGNHRENLDYR
jgi:hypothetical protein